MKKIFASLLAFSLALLPFSVPLALANPVYFVPTVQTSGTSFASSTISYLTPGTGTTTLYYNSYNQGINYKTEDASLLVQYAASSSNAVMNINVEYSHGNYAGADCIAVPSACDWYKDDINSFNATTSATTNNLLPVNTFTWQFASSTLGGAAVTNANGATSTKIIRISTPTIYTRVIFTMANPSASSGNASIWAQIIPSRQKAETR